MSNSILVEAARLVDGDRQQDYGHPQDDFKKNSDHMVNIIRE